MVVLIYVYYSMLPPLGAKRSRNKKEERKKGKPFCQVHAAYSYRIRSKNAAGRFRRFAPRGKKMKKKKQGKRKERLKE